MNVAGKWRVCSVEGYNDDYEKLWIDADEILRDKDINDSYKLMLESVFVFSDDGYIKRLIPVPEEFDKEVIDKAVEDGEIELYEDKILADKHRYKVEGDKVFFMPLMSSESGDPPWTEMQQADGKLQFFMFRLEKTE